MKKYIPITLVWSVITLLTLIEFGPLFIFLTIPFALIYMLFCFMFLTLKKITTKEINIKLSIIITSYFLVFLVHYIKAELIKDNADKVVLQIQAYKSKHGVYPKELLDIGIAENKANSKSLYYTKKNDSEDPTLFYPSTTFPFDSYFYNFKEGKWEFHPD